MNSEDLYVRFHRPLSAQAFAQFTELQGLTLQYFDPGAQAQDKWMYNCLKADIDAHVLFNWLWKMLADGHTIFFSLLLHNRVNTRNILRISMHLDCYEYVFCNKKVEETLMHLFLDHSYSQDRWASIFSNKERGISVFDETILDH